MPSYAILNACRTMTFVKKGTIDSRQEAGEWALGFVPEQHRGVVALSLEAYSGSGRTSAMSRDEVSALLAYAKEIVR